MLSITQTIEIFIIPSAKSQIKQGQVVPIILNKILLLFAIINSVFFHYVATVFLFIISNIQTIAHFLICKGKKCSYSSIDSTITRICEEYSILIHSLVQSRDLLIRVEGQKKENQRRLRDMLRKQRDLMVESFQKALEQLEEKILDKLLKNQEKFISDISNLDVKLYNLQSQCESGLKDMRTQSAKVLHQTIMYESEKDQLWQKVNEASSEARLIGKERVAVRVDEQQLQYLKKSVKSFMQIDIKTNINA